MAAKIALSAFNEKYKINLTDDEELLLLEQKAIEYGYQSELPQPGGGTIPNPETVDEFVCRMMLETMLQRGKVQRQKSLRQAKQLEADQQVATEFATIRVAKDV